MDLETDRGLTSPAYYRIRLVQQKTADVEMWTAEHPALLGCHVVRRTAQEAADDLAQVREEWIARALAEGEEVPAPEPNLYYELVLASDHTEEEAASARLAIENTGDAVPTERTTVAFA